MLYFARPGGTLRRVTLAHAMDARLGVLPGSRRVPGEGAKRVEEVFIAELVFDGPADRAGLQPDDAIVAVGDARIDSIETLRAVMAGIPPDAERPVRFRRGDAAGTRTLRFPAARDAVVSSVPLEGFLRLRDDRLTGLEVIELTPAERDEVYGDRRGGLVVTDVRLGSAAYGAGIRPGDRIVGAGGAAVESVGAFRALLVEKRAGEPLVVTREKGDRTVTARIDLADPDARRYFDLPLLARYSAGAEGSAFSMLGGVLFAGETHARPTPIRTGRTDGSFSLLFDVIHYDRREDASTLRLLWLVPIGL